MTASTNIVFITDNSGSMRSIARAAARDYNSNIASVREAAISNNQNCFVSVVNCGYGSRPIVHREIVNAAVTAIQPIAESAYKADAGGTPLFDSVMEAIKIFEESPEFRNPEASFLVMATTDGQENASKTKGPALAAKIRQLQATDRFTFVFRVPKGDARSLISYGIPAGNIMEWDQTERGVQASTKANVEAFTEYFTGRSMGKTATTRFYANLEDVTVEEVQAKLTDISDQVQFIAVDGANDQEQIRTFVEAKTGEKMVKGGAFYSLNRLEPKVQAGKRIAIREKASGKVFSGDAARQLLALPTVGTVRLSPDNLGAYDVFIQSTSVNRKLDAGTELMYWRAVGVAFKEGVSA